MEKKNTQPDDIYSQYKILKVDSGVKSINPLGNRGSLKPKKLVRRWSFVDMTHAMGNRHIVVLRVKNACEPTLPTVTRPHSRWREESRIGGNWLPVKCVFGFITSLQHRTAILQEITSVNSHPQKRLGQRVGTTHTESEQAESLAPPRNAFMRLLPDRCI